jgi:hypothetical protein
MKKRSAWYLVLSLLIASIPTMHGRTFKWDDALNFDHVESFLQDEPIEKIMSLNTLTTGHRATHKKVRLIRFKNGVRAIVKTGDYAYAEVAAYRASKALGLRLVPPTIFRHIEDELASVQLFVEGAVKENLLTKVSLEELANMKLFYFVLGQWDSNSGNRLFVKDKDCYQLVLIDNAAIRHRQHVHYGDFAFVEKAQNKGSFMPLSSQFPFDEAQILEPGPYEALFKVFKPFVRMFESPIHFSEEHVIAIWLRKRPLRYIVWNSILWVQTHKFNKALTPNYTDYYPQRTLDALKKLDTQILKQCWRERLSAYPDHTADLIALTLERRDQIIHASNQENTTL